MLLYLIGAEGPNGRHIPGDVDEVYWGTVAFFIVVGLLAWKALPLAKQSLSDRTARIESQLAEARSARDEAERALTASTAELPDVGAEEARIRSEALATAAKLKEDLIAKAEAEAEAVRERGRNDVINRKKQAQADLSGEISRMTLGSAEVIVKDGLNDSSQSDLIDNYINQVSQMS